MAIKSTRFLWTLSFIATLLITPFPAINVRAMAIESGNEKLPSLEAFTRQVSNGQAGELRGVYVPGILAAPIVQQPAGQEGFVSPRQNVVTQFRLASKQGSTGLLAHNYLAGEMFALLQKGQEIHLVAGDGQISNFIVVDILRYQALQPESPFSSFVDLDTQAYLNYNSLFAKVYSQPGQVIFQTCIQAGDELSWGRLFVIAEPLSE